MQAKIVTLPGDGIGVEVVAEGVKVLRAVAETYGHTFTFEHHLIGACAIDATGTALPEETLAACREANAVLLGAVGDPRYDDPSLPVRPEFGLMALRKELALYANVRPVHVYSTLLDASPLRPELTEGVDLLVVRELTGGIYFGQRREAAEQDLTAYDTMVYAAEEVHRIAHLAFKLAKTRRGKVTSVDKANILASSRLWRRIVTEVAEEYPDVAFETLLVDAATMHLLRRPSDFDVIVTTNLFGDILSDEASMLAGSMGLLPSASLGAGSFGLYEPIHGSAPDIAGQGVANPLATILSAAMLLRHSLKLGEGAGAIEWAVETTLEQGYRTADIAGPMATVVSTAQMGDAVIAALTEEARCTS
jgi:3-isopropylmalate dehydrogenase